MGTGNLRNVGSSYEFMIRANFTTVAVWLVSCLLSPLTALSQMPANYQLETDWQIDGSSFVAQVEDHSTTDGTVTLSNGLVRRVFRIRPNGATIALDNLMTDNSLLRSVRSEGTITVNGAKFEIGGLSGQPNHAYLSKAWIEQLQADPNALQLKRVTIGNTQQRFHWNQSRHHAPDSVWPPPGVSLQMSYGFPSVNDASGQGQEPPNQLRQVEVTVHYELYDGLPLFSKWLTLQNGSDRLLTVDRFTAEQLAVVEFENQVETREGIPLRPPTSLHVETDMAFGGFTWRNANRHTVHWETDPLYSTQVNYLRQQPCLLRVAPTFGPSQDVPPGATFETFRVFQLVQDSDDRERRGLALRKMYRAMAPWVTENPLMLHCTSADEPDVKSAIDQAAQTGFEMVILSFGSGFDAENDSPDYLSQWQRLNDYALSKGVQLGCYSLYSSRNAGAGNNIVPPKGMTITHGSCPAITSTWGQTYIQKLFNLFDKTGFMVFENDGPYPGDVDTTARPPLQKGEQDSRWVHWRIWTDFYKHLRGQGVYLNLPDYYFLSGSNKCGMGYREVNWSLPREQQRIHTRQNIFDGTWEKTPSMGWMFVPLVQYHDGGAAATIEPLEQHLDHYEIMLRSNLGLGVQACYRGPRLYDTDRTARMVGEVVAWYKRHRDILESDLIHGRRADGRDIDWMLHVNAHLDERALLSVYNPTDASITKTVWVPLYYSGLAGTVRMSENGDDFQSISLDAQQRARLTVTVPANGYRYWIFKAESKSD